jgi:hypothetical protein
MQSNAESARRRAEVQELGVASAITSNRLAMIDNPTVRTTVSVPVVCSHRPALA